MIYVKFVYVEKKSVLYGWKIANFAGIENNAMESKHKTLSPWEEQQRLLNPIVIKLATLKY